MSLSAYIFLYLISNEVYCNRDERNINLPRKRKRDELVLAGEEGVLMFIFVFIANISLRSFFHSLTKLGLIAPLSQFHCMFVSLGRKCESCKGIKRSWKSSWISSICSTDVFSMWHWTSCLKMLYIISVSFTWNKGKWEKEKIVWPQVYFRNFREQTWNMNAVNQWNEGRKK